MSKKSSLERAFIFFWRILGQDLPRPEHNYRFAAHHVGLGPGIRKRLERAGLQDWQFDFAFPEAKVAVEIEGGTFMRGRHVRPIGYENDCRKYNAGIVLGWVILRYTRDMLNYYPEQTFDQIRQIIRERTAQ